MPVLLVEGTRGVGKTTFGTLFSRGAELLPQVKGKVQLVPQRLTLGILGPMHELGLLDEDLTRVLLGRFVDWVKRVDEENRWIVLDTLHLTMWVRGILGPATFAAVDDAMAKLGSRAVLLEASIESIQARRVRDDASRCERWIQEQKTMIDLCASSALPWVIIDANQPPHTVLDSIYRGVIAPISLDSESTADKGS